LTMRFSILSCIFITREMPSRHEFPQFATYLLFLLLYWELLYVLLDVKPIVDLFLSFVESFSRLDREFDKPMIFFRL
uniref:Uncharacterized protein n=1 Tax=Aegilops tauschii subsp. strangulata TaxID=200361 RepID=A0A453SVW3_AEGTS